MNKKIINKINEILKNRKALAEHEALLNYNKALLIPKFKKLDTFKRELIVEIGKKESENINTSKLRKKLNDTGNEINKLIQNHFGDKFKLTPQYHCELCSDDGIINDEPCSCFKKEMSNLLMKNSGYVTTLSNFDNLSYEIYDDEFKNKNKLIFEKMKQWCEKLNDTKIRNVGIFGDTGVGKTFLTEAMASKLMEHGWVVFFITSFNLSQNLLRYHTTFDENKNDYIDPLLECDVLIIDDLGTEPIFKNISLEYLYLIINERVLKNKPIIFTTNLTTIELRDRYGERLFSRLLAKNYSLMIRMEGKDLRLKL